MTNGFDLLKEALVGKLVTHTNRYGREVTLKVEKAEHKNEYIETGPSTPQNDWWPDGHYDEWLQITFVDGSSIRASLQTNFKIVDAC